MDKTQAGIDEAAEVEAARVALREALYEAWAGVEIGDLLSPVALREPLYEAWAGVEIGDLLSPTNSGVKVFFDDLDAMLDTAFDKGSL